MIIMEMGPPIFVFQMVRKKYVLQKNSRFKTSLEVLGKHLLF